MLDIKASQALTNEERIVVWGAIDGLNETYRVLYSIKVKYLTDPERIIKALSSPESLDKQRWREWYEEMDSLHRHAPGTTERFGKYIWENLTKKKKPDIHKNPYKYQQTHTGIEK